MSALAQSPNLFCALRRRINEQEAILTIARAALTAADALSGLEAVANAALRLTGVHEVVASFPSIITARRRHWIDSGQLARTG